MHGFKKGYKNPNAESHKRFPFLHAKLLFMFIFYFSIVSIHENVLIVSVVVTAYDNNPDGICEDFMKLFS